MSVRHQEKGLKPCYVHSAAEGLHTLVMLLLLLQQMHQTGREAASLTAELHRLK